MTMTPLASFPAPPPYAAAPRGRLLRRWWLLVLTTTTLLVACSAVARGTQGIDARGASSSSSSSSSNSGSAGSHASVASSDATPATTTRWPRTEIPGWLKASEVVGALSTSPSAGTNQTHDDDDKDHALVVDGIVVRLAPAFAVTSTSLLSSRGLAGMRLRANATRVVAVFGDTALRVRRIHWESRYYASEDPDDALIVLELREPSASLAFTASLLQATPVEGWEFKHLVARGYDRILDTSATGRPMPVADDPPTAMSPLRFLPRRLCGLNATANDDDDDAVMCVDQQSQGPPKNGNPPPKNASLSSSSAPEREGGGSDGKAPMAPRAAMLMYKDYVVGFASPVDRTEWFPKAPRRPPLDAMRILRLASPRHRRFLEATIGAENLSWRDEDVFGQKAKFPSYLAMFVDRRGRRLKCQGVLIAPKYVLTTASCVERETSLARVGFFARNAFRVVSVLPEKIVKHPRHVPGDVMFDTAIVELAEEVDIQPVKLHFGVDGEDKALACLEVAASGSIITTPAKRKDIRLCRQPRRNSTQLSASFICIEPDYSQKVQAKDFIGDQRLAGRQGDRSKVGGASLVSIIPRSGVSLMGLAVCSSSLAKAETFVRVSNSATFINAYVAGPNWERPTRMFTIMSPVVLPFVVGLRNTKEGQNFCGGAMITPTHVLTAAHCVTDGPANYVAIGSQESSGLNAEIIPVNKTRTRVHPQYTRPHRFSHDAAILELTAAAYVDPVVLDTTPDFTHQEPATMYGYGVVSPSSDVLSPVVRILTLPIWSKSHCKSTLTDVDDSMLCAGGELGQDACTGDSGGPLVVRSGGNNYLAGFVSAGYGCGIEGVPGIYVRVSDLVTFIKSVAPEASWKTIFPSHHDDTTSSPSSSSPSLTSSSPASTPAPSPTQWNIEDWLSLRADRNLSQTWSPASQTNDLPVNVVSMDLGSLQPLVREALMQFLLGYDDSTVKLTRLYEDLASSNNTLHFYSTGSMRSLLDIVRRRSELPLYQRKDRFGNWKNRYARSDVRLSCKR